MNEENCLGKKKSCKLEMYFFAICLSASLAIGGYFIGQTMYNAKVAINTADVKGLGIVTK